MALREQLSHLRPEVRRASPVVTMPPPAHGRPCDPLPASKPPQRRITPELRKRLIDGYEAGQTTYELARRFGFNRNTIASHLRRAGVTIRMDGMTEDEIEQAISYYRNGWSLAQIGHVLGADAETVRKRLREAGLARRNA